jgi:transposase
MKTTPSSLPDPKLAALRRSSTLHPHPDRITDPLFLRHDFFDARDTLQVKYEMLRRVQIEGKPISPTAKMFGCSRPAFYQAQAAFKAQGLAGLLPHKRGPHRAHKLGEEVLDFVQQQRASQPPPSTGQLLQQIREHFQLTVHRRSLERAWARRKKKLRRTARSAPPSGRRGRRPGRRL